MKATPTTRQRVVAVQLHIHHSSCPAVALPYPNSKLALSSSASVSVFHRPYGLLTSHQTFEALILISSHSRLIKHLKRSSSSLATHSSRQSTPMVSETCPAVINDAATEIAVNGAEKTVSSPKQSTQGSGDSSKPSWSAVVEKGVVNGAVAEFALNGSPQNTVAFSLKDQTPATKTGSSAPTSTYTGKVITEINKASPAELRRYVSFSLPTASS